MLRPLLYFPADDTVNERGPLCTQVPPLNRFVIRGPSIIMTPMPPKNVFHFFCVPSARYQIVKKTSNKQDRGPRRDDYHHIKR